MKNYFNEIGIEITDGQIEKFNIYKDVLLKFNEMFNITTITEEEEIIKKHFIDSVIYADKLEGKTLIDIGSGGGFPAIPIKIMRDDLDVTLVEATGKKCTFLQEVIKELDLKNIKVINGRAEELALNPTLREKFDICTARAVARLNTLCEYCMPFVKVGGKFVSFKAESTEEVIEASNAIKTLGGKLNKVEKFDIFGNGRSVIIIDKEKNTPTKYPRGRGKERKNPL